MDKKDFEKIEKKWQRVWEKQGWYKAVDLDKKRQKLYVLVEFPYPSGSGLHVGHAFTMTGADVYARKKRMEGYNVLFPMGWDAFGLPTENYAIKTGIHPVEATKKNTDNFRRQMKKMAFSFDWSREINTTDPDYYHWTQWIFIQLFKHGLAYKKKMPINWCPSCKIGLANEEVINGRCERCGTEVSKKDLSQWIVKITDYAEKLLAGLEKVGFVEKVKAAQINWIGRSEGAMVKFPIYNSKLQIEVFTTRPDTLWGATFMVIAPEHELVEKILDPESEIRNRFRLSQSQIQNIRRYVEQARKKSDLERGELEKEKTGVFSGLYAINPVNNKKIPIWISDFVLASYGTGAIMAVPAHDQRDFEFAQKYNLPIMPVIEPYRKREMRGRESFELKEAYEGEGVLINSGPFTLMDSVKARMAVVEWLKRRNLGQPGVSYHLRDWIFSRQHYWGEPIPMIYCATCAKKGITWWDANKAQGCASEFKMEFKIRGKIDEGIKRSLAGWFPTPEEQLPVKLPEVKRYEPTGTGESPLAAVKSWVKTTCPVCGGPARRETDTMPNWAGSDWYYLAYIFGHKLGAQNSKLKAQNRKRRSIFEANKRLLRYWLPVDIYFGGDEHNTLHLLYSRFIYQFLHDIGAVPKEYPEPYLRRISHGLILGEDNQKMSKSRGNVINPDDVWEKYGVDALRTYLMFMGPYEGTMAWNSNALRGVARFLERFKRFVKAQSLELKAQNHNLRLGSGKDGKKRRRVAVALNRLIKKVSDDIESFSYNTAVAAMMEFLNEAEREKWQMGKEQLEVLLKLLAPFAPYLTEELWHKLNPDYKSADSSVHLSSWPKPDSKYLVEDEVEIVIQVDGKLRGTIKVESSKSKIQSWVEEQAKKEPKVAKYLKDKKIVKTIFVPGRLVNFVVK